VAVALLPIRPLVLKPEKIRRELASLATLLSASLNVRDAS
jgi:hypothetical protein